MPDTASAVAHGRVNLIGEHTDYHDGYVLPMAIPQQTRARVRRRLDRRVSASSASMAAAAVDYELGCETRGGGWLDYVQGVTFVLARRGIELPGFDLVVDTMVPIGAGVASSAALEVSLLRALRTLVPIVLNDVDLARVAQLAETDFVGAPVGIMDQMAASVGRAGEALFIDTRSLAVERVPLPSSIDVAVIDSGVRHAHAGGEYVTRRRESFEAAERLGVATLRDVDVATFIGRAGSLPPLLAARARHVVTENGRVLAAVDALRNGHAARLGALFAASHASMRDDYAVSTPAIDRLVEIAARHPAVYGARLTGGGFGGAVVVIAAAGRAREAADAICTAYCTETGLPGSVLVPAHMPVRLDA